MNVVLSSGRFQCDWGDRHVGTNTQQSIIGAKDTGRGYSEQGEGGRCKVLRFHMEVRNMWLYEGIYRKGFCESMVVWGGFLEEASAELFTNVSLQVTELFLNTPQGWGILMSVLSSFC